LIQIYAYAYFVMHFIMYSCKICRMPRQE